WAPDVVLYDVLGDVVCGGFSMPMRNGFADFVFILTSGENMAIHAAANIAMAVGNFSARNYAKLGGFILNKRNVKNEIAKVEELACDFNSVVAGSLEWSEVVQEAEELKKCVLSAFPDSPEAQRYRNLAAAVMERCRILQ
ncbi:MAG: nitrogenase iron protein, partial [Lentisphaeria bacterium]|nr:nitrogenase iron protein [Lentisphaeria bacterium]